MRCSFVLAPEPASAGDARRWAADIAVASGYRGVSEVLALLVSELVTNAVVHAGSPGSLVIDVDEQRLRAEVDDRSDDVPTTVGEVDPLAVGGRGLQLMRDLSDAHGFERLAGGGKVIWFELRRPPS